MEMDSNSGGPGLGPGLVPGPGQGQAESGGSSNESSSFSGGLMFGQKIYFEDGGGGGGGSGSSSSVGSGARRVRGSGSGQSGQIPRCQVEGCGTDLSNAKSYYSRHRVCGMHSKTPKVIVAGLEQRFCQQCSRFHQLPEFDLEKRSCRRRLAGHNERRRKPQPASLSVLSSRYGRLSPSSLYGNADSASFLGNQEMGWSSGRTLDSRLMRRPVSTTTPSWQINPMNVFTQGTSVSGGGGTTSFTSPEFMDTKLESYKASMGDSSCALSLLSNPHQDNNNNNNNNNNNTWRASSGFGPMTVTMAQPPPATTQQHQYLNPPPWIFKDDDNSCPNDLSPVLNLGRFTEPDGTTMGEFDLSDHHHHHHQSRRQYMEPENNTRGYDSSSHHINWSL